MGKEFEKQQTHVYVRVTESVGCTPEINTILLTKYTPTENKKLKKKKKKPWTNSGICALFPQRIVASPSKATNFKSLTYGPSL